MGLPLDIVLSTFPSLTSKPISLSFSLQVLGLCVWLGARGVKVNLFSFSLKEEVLH